MSNGVGSNRTQPFEQEKPDHSLTCLRARRIGEAPDKTVSPQRPAITTIYQLQHPSRSTSCASFHRFSRLHVWSRHALRGACLLAASACTLAAFPDKPIRVVIGCPAGGPLDQHARLLTERLQAVLGRPIIIDYKSGAGGTAGAQGVMRAAPDGYTLMLANTGVRVISPALYSKLPYSTLKDFTPIARTATWCRRCSRTPPACSWSTFPSTAARRSLPI